MSDYQDLIRRVRAGEEPSASVATGGPQEDLAYYRGLAARVRGEATDTVAANLNIASVGNPVSAAEKANLARQLREKLGEEWAPQNVDPVEAQRRLRVVENDHALNNSPRLARQYLDKGYAERTFDDVPALVTVDQAVDVLKATGKTLLGGMGAGAWQMSAGLWGVPRAAADLAGWTSASRYLAQQQAGAKAQEESIRRGFVGLDEKAPYLRNMAFGAVESAWQSLATAPLALQSAATSAVPVAGNLLQRIMQQSAAIDVKSLLPMMLSTGGEAYGKAVEQGVDPLQAAMLGVSQGVFEGAGERIGLGQLARDVKLSAPLWTVLRNQLISENVQEQFTQHLQDLNEWAVLPGNTNKTFGDYLAERPSAALDTAVQTTMATLMTTGALRTAMMSTRRQMGAADLAQEYRANLEGLVNSVAAAQTTQRSPQDVASLIKAGVEDEGGEVFIDANAAARVLNQEQLAQLVDDPAEFATAVQTGGDIVVPLERFTLAVAQDPAMKGILDHARRSEDDISAADAAHQQEAAQAFQQAAKQVAEERASDEVWTTSAKAVEDDLFRQMQEAGRFTSDKNRADAMLAAQIFSVWADRMGKTEQYAGMTPEDAYRMFALRVGAQQVAGDAQRMDQGGTVFDWEKPGGGIREAKVGDTTIAYGYDGKSAHIASVRTPSAKRNKGSARAAMQKFLAETDALGIPVKLESSPLDKRTKDARLFNFYKSLGFEPTGRTINAAGDPEMVRQPRQPTNPPARPTNPLTKLFQAVTNALGITLPADTIGVDGVQRPTLNSNGKPIAQGEEELRNFWRWFGDSKVVDAEGRPLVVYHSTTYGDFDIFSKADQRKGMAGYGFYFSDAEGADIYSKHAAKFKLDRAFDGAEKKVNVMPVYLSMRNPLVVDNINDVLLPNERSGFGVSREFNRVAPDAKLRLEREGYDGVLAHEYVRVKKDGSLEIVSPDAKGAIKHPVYVVFEPTQIKSATGNRGTFNPTDANILNQGPVLDMGQFFNQPAYHGSPYKFDKFSLEHIGRGEGAQAYGWGLYFAGKKGVAEHYRQALSKTTPAHNTIDGKRITKKLLEELQNSGDNTVRAFFGSKAGARAAGITSIAKAVDDAIETAQESRDDYQQRLDAHLANPPLASTYGPADYQRFIASYDRQIDGLQKLKARIGYNKEQKGGQLYEVEIPDDGQYLLWDKPLSEQPDRITAALAGSGADWEANSERETGKHFYERLVSEYGSQEEASKVLNSWGIAGIKYLDGTSRNKGEGSYNYVIFDDSAVEILNTYYQNQGNNRAEIAFGRDITQTPSVITLFKNADLSSFLHEMGHFQLEVLANIASQPNAPAEIVQDMEKVLAWFGIRGDEAVAGGETAGSLGQPGTDAFARWFGDSKVVDAEGKPLVVYHGTNQSIESFLRERGGANTGSASSRGGFFFTEDSAEAGDYANMSARKQVSNAIEAEANAERLLKAITRAENKGDFDLAEKLYLELEESEQEAMSGAERGANILPVYLSISNPLVFDMRGKDLYDMQAAIDEAKERGHDGLRLDNVWDPVADREGLSETTQWIAFEPTQIKSAIGNRGTFDPNDPNILHQGDDQTASNPGALPKRRTALEVWQAMSLEEKRPFHEQFARGFEAYLFEGRAPTPELQPLFSRFRAWLINVYKSIKALNVEISDDIRGVFDRLVATDEAIREAEAARAMAPTIPGTEEAAADATQAAIDQLQRRSLRDMQWLTRARGRLLKQLQADAKAKRKAVEAEVRAEVEAMPVYTAMRFLRTGEMIGPDGEQIKIEKGYRLDTAALAEMYPETMLARPALEKLRGMTTKGGLHPDVVAGMFGFTSGDQLVRELIDAEAKGQLIEGLTDQRMLERYGDLTNPDTLDRAIDEAIHNDMRLKVLATELQAATKAQTPVRAIMAAAKDYAERFLAGKKVKDIKPRQHAAAGARAGKAALQAFGKGDTATLAAEKRTQVLQGYLTKLSYEALDEVDKAVRYLRKFDADIKTLDPDYADQIDQLLERFDLRASVGNKAAEKRASLLSWVEAQREQGFEPDIPPDLLTEALRKPYKELTLEELRGLVDTVKQIEHLGRLKHKLLTAKDQREFEAARDEIVASIQDNAKKSLPEERASDRGFLVSTKRLFRYAAAIHRKFSSLARGFDGYKDGGPAWEYLVRNMNERGDFEAVETEKAAIALTKLLTPVTDKVNGKLTQKQYFPSIGKSFSREERISMLLNMGNETNLERLLTGERLSPAQLQEVVGTLTKTDTEFVNAVHAFIDSYWPQVAEKERRVTGRAPEKVEAQPFTLTLNSGETVQMRGGYYPIAYDPIRSERSGADVNAEVARQIQQGLYARAQTRRGHTKARVESTGRPLRYDFGEVIASHVTQVIHDLAWHEYLIDANRLLRSAAIENAVREHYGVEVLKEMKDTLRDIAIGSMGAEKGATFWNHLRYGTTIAGLGWNVFNTLQNLTGITQSMSRIGTKWVAKGAAHWAGDAASMESSIKKIHEKSDFMRLRAKTLLREVNEIRNKVAGKDSKLMASFFWLQAKTQLMVDVPTWWGAYEKAMAEDEMTEDKAVALADQAVIDAQGSGQIKDLAGIQRGGAGMKLFTTFYSFFNTTFNLTAEAAGRTNFKKPGEVALFAADMALLYTIPALLTTLLKAALMGDWDDEEKLTRKIIGDQLSFAMGTVIGLREAAAAAQAATGTGEGFGYTGPASVRFFSDLYNLGKQAQQGEADEAFWKALNNSAGVIFHYPAGQINRTATGIAALSDGRTENPLAVVMGAPRP